MPTSRQRLSLMTPCAHCLVEPSAVQALYPLHVHTQHFAQQQTQSGHRVARTPCEGLTTTDHAKLQGCTAGQARQALGMHGLLLRPTDLEETRLMVYATRAECMLHPLQQKGQRTNTARGTTCTNPGQWGCGKHTLCSSSLLNNILAITVDSGSVMLALLLGT